ncbi:MAG TPA: hypothetical protein VIR02_05690, partial [Anaerolineales bacterium]
MIIILLVALLAAGTLLAGRAGIRSIQQARKVVFYRTRRSYMLAGWQWLVLALVLLSSTVASVLFGESLANQILIPSPVPQAVLPTRTSISRPTNANERTKTPAPSPTLRQTRTESPSQTTPEPVSMTPTTQGPSTLTPAPSRTLLPTATQTVTRTPVPSLTQDLSALATRAARTLEAQLAIAALSHTPTRTKTGTPTASFTPTLTATLTPSSTPT